MLSDKRGLIDYDYPLSQLLLMKATMKRPSIKHLVFILLLLPITSSADFTSPSDEAKTNFAKCVDQGNAWADCDHILYPDQIDINDIISSIILYPAGDVLPVDHAPKWSYILIPSFRSADNLQGLSAWNPTPGELFLRDHYDVPNNPYYENTD